MKRVKIYAIHYNRSEFVQWQHDCFKAHLKNEYDYIVVNNARDSTERKKINKQCNALGINVIETFSKSELAGLHHVESYNYIWQLASLNNKDNYVIMMDGDCFLVKSFDVNSFMGGNVLAGPKQQREYVYHYLTPTLIIADIGNLPDANTIDWEGIGVGPDQATRLDTGGGLYNYFLTHQAVKDNVKEIKSSWHIKIENNNLHCLPDELLSSYDNDYHVEFFGNEFLHYCRSSNWNNCTAEHHLAKSKFVKEFIYRTIDGTIEAKEHNYQIDNKIYFGWG